MSKSDKLKAVTPSASGGVAASAPQNHPSAPPVGAPQISASEERKRELDIQKIEYDLGRGRLLEYFKAFTGLGIIFTILLGLLQLRQTQQARDDERFERSITRLGSREPSERLIGLAGLEQYLKSSTQERQESVLLFLVNAVVIEKDETVRDALLDSLEGLRDSSVSKSALNAALVAARDRNRALLKRLTDAFWKTLKPGERWPKSPELTEAPIGPPDADGRAALDASARAVASLIQAGAYVQDLSQTYCVACKFSTKDRPANLARVNFDGSFLRQATFEHANLTEASFHNAALITTHFSSANLRGAKFTADIPATPWQEIGAMSNGTTLAIHGADFSCSDLTSADFSGRAVFSVLYGNPVIGISGDSFGKADLTNTKLDSIQILLGFPTELVESMGGKERFDLHKALPIVTGQWSGPSDPVPSIKGNSDYYIYVVSTGSNFKFEGTFDPKSYWDLILQLRNLNGARNLDKALLAKGLRDFMTSNHALISPSLGEPRC